MTTIIRQKEKLCNLFSQRIFRFTCTSPSRRNVHKLSAAFPRSRSMNCGTCCSFENSVGTVIMMLRKDKCRSYPGGDKARKEECLSSFRENKRGGRISPAFTGVRGKQVRIQNRMPSGNRRLHAHGRPALYTRYRGKNRQWDFCCQEQSPDRGPEVHCCSFR